MSVLRFHEISEARHRILNPYDEEKLMLLGEVCRLAPGQRVLDLACGKGELLARWAQQWQVTGVGVACIGATWIGGGVTGTIELLRPALRPGGLILIGEPFWNELPEKYPSWTSEGEFTSLVGLLDTFEAAGCELLEMIIANPDTWDRYAAGQW